MARRLAVQDAGWLMIESPERPMHVGGPALFSPPTDAPPDWLRHVVADALQHQEVRPPLNRKLSQPYGRLGTYAWVETDVDLTYHVRHLALPQPGRIRELLSLVSRLHATLLDRHRPLWEMYLIEGLADGRFALYTRVHHSLLDGVAAVRQILGAFSTDPDERDLPPPWAPHDGERSSRSDRQRVDPMTTLVRSFGGGIGAVTSTLGAMRSIGGQVLAAMSDGDEVAPLQAPASMLNVPLTSSRRFVAQDYDLDRLRAVGKAAGVPLNDVVLAMCGGALRAYLQSHDALPDKPLIAFVPVSIRSDDSSEGNAVSFLLANLGTHLADPLARLEAVHESTSAAKRRLAGMTQAERLQYAVTLAAPMMLSQLLGIGARLPTLYNVVVSNVPGPDAPLYWNGARMDGMYPASLIVDGYALNITQTSYAGKMAFGVTADRQRVPSVQRLIDHLEDALKALETATGA